jgi:hypothetical protein
MKRTTAKSRLQRELRRLFRSMDFVSRHPALEKEGAEAERFAEIYQQLGLAWEFLARQCGHWDGFRKTRDGRKKCKICGRFEDAAEPSVPWPNPGKKRIGKRSVPDSDATFANNKAATLIDDAIDFHGAKLRVIVQNAYRTKLLGKMDITIAADRMVRLVEGEVECRLDTHMIWLRLAPRKKGQAPPCAAFPWELSRARLKRFPVLLESDEDGKFAGVTIFKPRRGKASPVEQPLRGRAIKSRPATAR